MVRVNITTKRALTGTIITRISKWRGIRSKARKFTFKTHLFTVPNLISQVRVFFQETVAFGIMQARPQPISGFPPNTLGGITCLLPISLRNPTPALGRDEEGGIRLDIVETKSF